MTWWDFCIDSADKVIRTHLFYGFAFFVHRSHLVTTLDSNSACFWFHDCCKNYKNCLYIRFDILTVCVIQNKGFTGDHPSKILKMREIGRMGEDRSVHKPALLSIVLLVYLYSSQKNFARTPIKFCARYVIFCANPYNFLRTQKK